MGEDKKTWVSKVGLVGLFEIEWRVPCHLYASRVFQYLSDKGKDDLYKIMWEYCRCRQTFDHKCVQNLQHWLEGAKASR